MYHEHISIIHHEQYIMNSPQHQKNKYIMNTRQHQQNKYIMNKPQHYQNKYIMNTREHQQNKYIMNTRQHHQNKYMIWFCEQASVMWQHAVVNNRPFHSHSNRNYYEFIVNAGQFVNKKSLEASEIWVFYKI